jgi:cardiolipin synthase
LWRAARDTWALVRTLARHGVGIHWTNKIYGRLYQLANRNHKKILIIDDRVAYIGGVNFSDHNFGWHDLMLRIDDPDMAAWLADDILATWAGRNQGVSRTFRDGQLTLLDGRHGWPLQQQLFDQIASARHEVVVISSYASEPYFDPLEAAARRGARVMILTPATTNWGWFDAYTRIECARRGFELYRLPWRMSHMKAMLIDSQRLIVGSSNFDYFGHQSHQELLFETTDGQLVRDFRTRIVEPDLARASRHLQTDGFPWQDRLVRFLLRTGFFLTPRFNRMF